MNAKGMAREPAEGVEISTRVLVESLVREDGTVDAGELYTVAGTLGMSDQQVRLCVRRLVADGRFVQQGRGRRAVLRATGDTRHALEPEADFLRLMYAQDRGEAPWDGVWHLVAFAVPETERAARDALRETIVHLGGAPLQGGLYVAANAWEDLVGAAAGRLGVDAHVTYLTSTDLRVGGVSDPVGLAARLWPLDDLAEGHRRLAATARAHLDRLRGDATPSEPETVAIALELAAAFTAATEPDPLLPPELLPSPWPGTRARELVARCWAELLRRPPRAPAPRLFRWYADVVEEITGGAPTGPRPGR
ncbi:PaaX family transcriptional regulator C-terminal domain-containing protein [Actinomadura kijaniata]|uniref:PaaX family transcriptional regulator C-terminal domain-containing protein n=1 Tax=Actinomadura kijaniata TaxID=46161 RepID=UPI000A78D995|nr:PaaX family transcriptional regulator C-terminal domain-containing protein [Actinomadura kijaniata]